MKRVLLLIPLLSGGWHATCQTGADNPILDSYIIEQMAMGGFVGMGAGIILEDQLVWSRGYGYADLDQEKSFTPSTLINVASITQTVTAACVMKLVEKQFLFLDFPVNEVIPFEIPREISLRHLATHTSGITDRDDYHDRGGYFYGDAARTPLGPYLMDYLSAEGKAFREDNFLNAEPGMNYAFSNIGAGLAGYVVECVSGTGLYQFSQEYFLKPLGMTSSGWFMKDIDASIHSRLYKRDGAAVIPSYELASYPGGNLRSSVEELSKFLICMANRGNFEGRQILKAETVEQMLQPQFEQGQFPAGFEDETQNSGIFWAIQSGRRGEKVIGQSGSDPGVLAKMYYNLSGRYGVILLMNTEGSAERADHIFQELWNTANEMK